MSKEYICPFCMEQFNTNSPLHRHMIKKHQRYHLDENELCTYGCGQPAKFLFKSGIGCCVSNSGGCPKVLEGIKQTTIERFGVANAFQSDEIKQKIKNTLNKKYGVDYLHQSDVIKQKYRDTCLSRYGFDNPGKVAIYRDKMKQTNIERYGTENPTSLPEIRDRVEKTNILKFGAKYPLQNPKIMDAAMINQQLSYYRRKLYVFPSGKTVNVRGYEPKVIDELLRSGLAETDLVCEVGEIPKINYVDVDGKTRRYYPDIYLPRFNLLLEVKSMYTFLFDKENNLRKRQASIEAGYCFRFVIR